MIFPHTQSAKLVFAIMTGENGAATLIRPFIFTITFNFGPQTSIAITTPLLWLRWWWPPTRRRWSSTAATRRWPTTIRRKTPTRWRTTIRRWTPSSFRSPGAWSSRWSRSWTGTWMAVPSGRLWSGTRINVWSFSRIIMNLTMSFLTYEGKILIINMVVVKLISRIKNNTWILISLFFSCLFTYQFFGIRKWLLVVTNSTRET